MVNLKKIKGQLINIKTVIKAKVYLNLKRLYHFKTLENKNKTYIKNKKKYIKK